MAPVRKRMLMGLPLGPQRPEQKGGEEGKARMSKSGQGSGHLNGCGGFDSETVYPSAKWKY